MGRRLSILTLICCSLLCTMVGINGVFADNNGEAGSTGNVGKCSDGYCYRGTVGFRITIVNKDGNRLTYKGKESISIDYWFDKKTIEGLDNKYCFAYNEKKTKKEFLDEKSSVVKCRTATTDKNGNTKYTGPYAKLYDITDLGFGKVNSNSYLEKWETSSGGAIEEGRTAINISRIIDVLSCSQNVDNSDIATSFNTDENGKRSTLNCKDLDGNLINSQSTNNKYLNKIFQNAFNDNTIDVSKFENLDGAYVQFEQLLQIVNFGGPKGAETFIATGTVAESSYLYQNYKSTPSHDFRWCVLNPSSATVSGTWVGNNTNCSTSMSLGGYWSGWYGTSSAGIGLRPPQNKLHITDINSFKLGSSGKVNKNFNMELFYKKDTSNVFGFWVNPKISGTCDEELRNILTNSSSYFSKDSGVSETKLKQYINDNSNKYQNLINDCANTDASGNVTSFKSSCPLLYKIDKLSVVLSAKMNYSNYSCSSDIECNSGLIDSITETYGEIIERIRKNIFIDGNDNYEDNNVYYRMLMKWLVSLFPGQARLNDSVWATLGDNGPSCNSIPSCKPTTPNGDMDCDNPSQTFSTNKDPECIKQGISYTIDKNNAVSDLVSSLNTSYDGECENCKVFCDEDVSFDLSNQSDLNNRVTKSGTLLKWGSGPNYQIYGTMSVKQKCYVVPNDGYTLGTTAYLKTKELHSHLMSPLSIDNKESSGKYVNTKITIDYINPAAYLKNSNENLNQKVTLVAIPTTRGILSVKHTGDHNDITIPNIISISDPSTESLNYATTYTDTNHKNIKEFTVQANYVFSYGTYTGCIDYDSNGICKSTASISGGVGGESVLSWYSERQNGKYKSENEYNSESKEIKSSYVFIGYGLPTPFTSATCSYTKSSMSSQNSNAEKEPITVTIQNIGTSKNKTNEDDSNAYLFTKLLGDKKNISYNCTYKIYNNIFGYENGKSVDCSSESPKGLDVVFRTVELMNTNSSEELNRAFPGMSGNGREKGANWAKLTEEEIFNVLNSSIYSQKPMYHITLDVTTIQKIRKWNKKARDVGRDPYTDMTALTNEENKNDGNDSFGYTGYVFKDHETDGKVDGTNIMSRFLGQLFREGDLDSVCFTSSGSVTNHQYKCNQ